MRSLFSMAAVMLFAGGLYAQDATRLRPGKLYHAGEEIYAPTYGFTATIPQGWSGMLPQGTELFLLSRDDGRSGEVIVAARENSDLETIADVWQRGGNLTESILLKAEKEIHREDDLMYADVDAEGERINKSYKAFITSRCGPYGPCVSVLMITPEQFFEEIKEDVLAFIKSGSFSEPQDVNQYTDFDWQRFLSNKMMVAYVQTADGKRQNELDLCMDGSFSANIRRSGWLKDDAGKYKGRLKGTWHVSGKGPETTLTLEFTKKNLEPFDVLMKIDNEQIFANGVRHYAGYSLRCD